MKKAIVILVLAVLCCVLSFPAVASANSALRDFYGIGSSDAIITTENCPVEVSAERLTFNINSFPQVYGSQADYNANVVAEYDFYNPEDYDANMQLVFPFGTLPEYVRDSDYNDTDKYGIFVADKEVERTVRVTYSSSDFNLRTDLPKISDTPVLLNGFDQNAVVYKYTVNVNYTKVDNAEFYETEFSVGKKLLVVDSDYYVFYSAINGSNTMRIRGNSFTLYSIGRQLDDEFFNAEYSGGVRGGKGQGYKDVKTDGKVSNTYEEISLFDLLCAHYKEESGILKTDYYNAAADCFLLKYKDGDACNYSDLDLQYELMYWYQYNVSVPAKQTVTNKVVAPLYPDINEYYTPTMYKYYYLLSPASTFTKFSNLDITINTDSYILSSDIYIHSTEENKSVNFVKTENGYSAHFDTLPYGDLSFELCASENPEYDNGMDGLWILLIALAIPFLFIFVVIIVVIVVVVTRKRKNRKEMEKVGNSQTISDEQRDKAMQYFFDDVFKDNIDKK